MHSGLLIAVWLLGVALLQWFPFVWLLGLLAVLAGCCAVFARARARRLVLRVRVLLLAIFILFAWFTPGTAVLIDWPSLSPTREGLMLALEHSARVLSVVLCVALLMQVLPPSRLVGGIHALLKVFEPVGFPASRVAVRTLLVLEYVDGDRSGGWRQWLFAAGEARHSVVEVPVEPFGFRDWAVLFAVVLMFAFLWVWL